MMWFMFPNDLVQHDLRGLVKSCAIQIMWFTFPNDLVQHDLRGLVKKLCHTDNVVHIS